MMSIPQHSSISFLLALTLQGTSVLAQTRADETRRTSLIQQATQARSSQQWERVIQLLRQVIDIRATASVRLGLAGAHQELRQYDEAASQAALCMQTAPTDRDLQEERRAAMIDTMPIRLPHQRGPGRLFPTTGSVPGFDAGRRAA